MRNISRTDFGGLESNKKKMKILVTGGLGYIGSHTAVKLSKHFEVLIVDNLINSNISVIDSINKISFSKVYFEKGDLTDLSIVKRLLKKSRYKGYYSFCCAKISQGKY